MDSKKKEIFKTCILVVLVFTSLLQVGILSGYGNSGFPAGILQGFFTAPSISQGEMDERAREEYFVPFRIIVYGGEGELRHVVGQGSGRFDLLWQEGTYYLRQALKSSNITEVDARIWDSLIHKRSIIFEMSDKIPLSLVEWFLEISPEKRSSISGVYKMMIAPDESIYQKMNTFYIFTGEGLYRAEVEYPAAGMNKRSDYHAFMEELKSEENIETYRVFGATGYPYNIPADLLGSFSRSKRLRHINNKVPEEINDVDHLTGVLLDEYRESYDRSVADGRTYVFQTLSKMFRVYGEKGVLEYRYTGRRDYGTARDAGKIFSLVYRFIAPKKQGLIPDTQMYLHSVKAIDAYTYRFEFNYRIGGYPVYINSEEGLHACLVVEANEEQILYCKWMLREVTYDRVSANYNNHFLSMLDEMKNVYDLSPDELYKSEEGYVLGTADRGSIEPVWIIKCKDGKLYGIPMRRDGVG